MASEDSTRDSFRQRLLAVLDYDGIPERQRVKHVACSCGLSLSTSRRLLCAESDADVRHSRSLYDLAEGLSVNWLWLNRGNLDIFDQRTVRIYLIKIEQWTIDEADGAIYSLLSGMDGESDYLNYGCMLSPMDVMWREKTRRMTEWERNKQLRLCLRLINDDKKARRLMEMSKRGQITHHQLLSMM